MARQSSQQAQQRLLELCQERGLIPAMLEAAENGIVLVRLWEDFKRSKRKQSTRMEYTREWLQVEQREVEAEIKAQMLLLVNALIRELQHGNKRTT